MGLISFTPLVDGTGIDANDVNVPFQQLFNEFNGNITDTNIATGSLSAAKMVTGANIETYRSQATADFIQSGLGVTTSAGLIGAIASGVVYVSGVYAPVIGVGSVTFTASKDTYIDVDSAGTLYYTGVQVVANGAAAPALTAGRFRIAKVITGASAITSITSTGFDSLGNVYSNKNPMGFNTVFFPTLLNGWVNFDTTQFGPCYYTKDKTGMVTLNGIIKSGTTTAATILFTLPAGYRPGVQLVVSGIQNDVIGRLDIKTNGDVVLGLAGSATYTSFNNVRFHAIG